MIIGLWGEDKSCKSTLVLSAPRPLVELEFDIGGFERACRNLPHLPIKDWYDAGEIILEQFVMPFQGVQLSKNGNIEFTANKTVTGIKELFYQFVTKYFNYLKRPDIASFGIETGTLLYNTVICDGYLQELQEKQLESGKLDKGEKLRTMLQQQEYKEPYDRMRAIIYHAKTHKKNLVISHHATDEYKPMPQKDGTYASTNTGKRIRHGWNQLGDSVDVMVHCYTKEEPVLDEDDKPVKDERGKPKTKLVPYGKIELCEVLEAVGLEFREPTFDQIKNTIDFIKGVF